MLKWVTVSSICSHVTCLIGNLETDTVLKKLLILIKIDKCIKIYVVFKKYDRQTMCEALWRKISDFYVNLRVEVGKHPQVILVMYFYLRQE